VNSTANDRSDRDWENQLDSQSRELANVIRPDPRISIPACGMCEALHLRGRTHDRNPITCSELPKTNLHYRGHPHMNLVGLDPRIDLAA
jgi:hypothetical protein